jgi:hypothetical protein
LVFTGTGVFVLAGTDVFVGTGTDVLVGTGTGVLVLDPGVGEGIAPKITSPPPPQAAIKVKAANPTTL